MPRIIGGTERSRVLVAPEGMDTRPTLDRVRENLFNILQHHVPRASVLDLFAGSGAIGLEAVSRGASSAVLVDNAPAAATAIRMNIAALRYDDRCRFLQMDWQRACQQLAGEGKTFSFIYLDPPYEMVDLQAVLAALVTVAAPDCTVVIEHDAKRLPAIAEGWLVSQQRIYGVAGLLFLTMD